MAPVISRIHWTVFLPSFAHMLFVNVVGFLFGTQVGTKAQSGLADPIRSDLDVERPDRLGHGIFAGSSYCQ